MASSMKGDENSSLSHPVQCSALRKGGFVLLKDKPCKIVEMSSAKPGKHGHAKVHLIGLDLFHAKKIEDVFPSSHRVQVPDVKREEILVSNISDNYITLLLDSGKLETLKITKTCEKTSEEAMKMFDDAMDTVDDEMVAITMTTMGEMVVKDFKVRKAK